MISPGKLHGAWNIWSWRESRIGNRWFKSIQNSNLPILNFSCRDLAARNLLVSEGRVLKISDFGLSRHGVYVNTRKRMLPLRWLALESMTDNLYSSLSDVWAFGVVLWEICTLGFSHYFYWFSILKNNKMNQNFLCRWIPLCQYLRCTTDDVSAVWQSVNEAR